MAKFSRKVVGSIMKSKEPTSPDYIKVRDDIVLKKGQTLRLESQKFQLQSLEKAVSDGKLNNEVAEQIKERIEKIPTFVRFEIVMLEEK